MIFKKTMTATKTAQRILNANMAAILTLYTIIDGVEKLINFFNNFLTKFGKLLKSAGETVDTAADVVKKAPAPGPWKILVQIVGTILDSVGKIIKAIGSGIEKLGKLARANKSAIEKLEATLKKAREALEDLQAIHAIVLQKIAQLESIATKLEEEQDAIEAIVPIRPAAEPIIDEINALLKEIEKFQKAVLDPIKPLQDEIAKIQATIDSLNPLEKLLVEFDNAIRPLREAVQKAMKKAKEALEALWLDKALDAMDKLIDWILEKTGIKAGLNKAGEAIKQLPFIKKIGELKKQAEAVLKSMEAKLQAVAKLALDRLKEMALVQSKTLSVYLKYLPLAATKLRIEWLFPDSLSKLKKAIGGIRKGLGKPPGPDASKEEWEKFWKRAWEELKKHFGDTFKQVALVPTHQFGGASVAVLHETLVNAEQHVLAIDVVLMAEGSWSADILESVAEDFNELEKALEECLAETERFAAQVEMQPEQYYVEFSKLLVEETTHLSEFERSFFETFLASLPSETQVALD